MKVHISDVIVPERLRKLDITKVDELAQSIKQIGLLQPIVIDTENNLLAGNHRLEAFKNIGYERIECKIVNLPEQKRKLVEIDENIIVSELSIIEKAEHIALKECILQSLGIRATQKNNQYAYALEGISSTTKELAAEIGIGRRQYQKIKQVYKINDDARLMLKNSAIDDNLDALLLIERLHDDGLQLEIAKRVKNGYDGKIRQLIKDIQNEILQNEILAKLDNYESSNDGKVQLYQGEFQQVSQQIPDASVDLIFTDPEYFQIVLYQDLAKIASRVLVDGGLCLCYIYQSKLHDVLNVMTKHLTYNWLICAKNGGANGRDGYGWFAEYSPILVMVKGQKQKNSQFTADFVQSQPSGKVYHEWEQSEVESSYYISKLTNVGDVVLDMMMGSGTTGLSARQLNRRFIGIEQNERTFAIAKGRITNRDKDCH